VSPKDIVNAITAEWFCDKVLTAAAKRAWYNSLSFSYNTTIWGYLSIRLNNAFKAASLKLLDLRFKLYLLLLLHIADPLSIITSAVGIIIPALHSTQLLLKDLQQLKNTPKTVKRLVKNVHSVNTALKLL
jgi:hypothetical protein